MPRGEVFGMDFRNVFSGGREWQKEVLQKIYLI